MSCGLIERAELRCSTGRELDRPRQLRLTIQLFQRRIDMFLVDMAPAKLGDKRTSSQPFAFVLRAHKSFRECCIVDQTDPLESFNLELYLCRVEFARDQDLLKLPAGHIAARERMHAHILRTFGLLRGSLLFHRLGALLPRTLLLVPSSLLGCLRCGEVFEFGLGRTARHRWLRSRKPRQFARRVTPTIIALTVGYEAVGVVNDVGALGLTSIITDEGVTVDNHALGPDCLAGRELLLN